MEMRIICSGCAIILVSSASGLTVDHQLVGMSITAQATCPLCGTIMLFDITNKIQRQPAEEHVRVGLKRIEEKLDAVLRDMPTCNCRGTHMFDQGLQRTSWHCPVHGRMDVWPGREDWGTAGTPGGAL